jgi:hypothetical protein
MIKYNYEFDAEDDEKRKHLVQKDSDKDSDDSSNDTENDNHNSQETD